MDLGLKGKRALITGGTRGIGRAIAETLAAEGCAVAICARNADQVASAVEALKAKGVAAAGQAVDVSKTDQVKAWVDFSAAELGGVDIYVSNVSAGGGGNAEANWRANFDADLMSTVAGFDAAARHIRKQGGGSLLAISTTAAVETFAGVQSYNAIKAALINYAKMQSQALAKDQINVNCVSPGPVYIEGGSWNFIKDHMGDFYKATLAGIPMGRMGAAQDVANAVAFLVSPAARYITGCNVVVDGGFTKRVQY